MSRSFRACWRVSAGSDTEERWYLRSTMLNIMAVIVRMAEARIAHGHQLDEEEHKNGHQRNAFRP